MSTSMYILIGIGFLILNFSIWVLPNMLRKASFKRKLKKLFEQNYSNKPLTHEQKRMLAFGAILFAHRYEKITDLTPKGLLNIYKGMDQMWEIVNPKEAIDTLNSLLSLQRTQELDLAWHHNPNDKVITDTQALIANHLPMISLEEVKQTTSTYAWDICRAVAVAKWSFWLSYITEEQFWDCLEKASTIASEIGRDWKDYACSYLMGRELHGFGAWAHTPYAKGILDPKIGGPWYIAGDYSFKKV